RGQAAETRRHCGGLRQSGALACDKPTEAASACREGSMTKRSLSLVVVALTAASSVACIRSEEPQVTGVQSAVLTNVTVTVVDTGGLAQANVTVFAQTNSGARSGFIDSDSAGHAVLAMSNGDYKFGVTLGDTTYFSGADGHCHVPTCTSATITVQRPVTVTVLDEQGHPQDDAGVRAEDAQGNL